MDDQKRGGVPWTPPLLEVRRPDAGLKICNPDCKNSAIGSYMVVDSNLNKRLAEYVFTNINNDLLKPIQDI